MNRPGIILMLLTALVFAGCLPPGSPRAKIKSGGGLDEPRIEVTQIGPAHTPVSVKVETAKHTIPLPAASELVFDESKPGAFTLRLSKDTQIVSQSRVEQTAGPTAFTPPAPPTPKEEAEGKADFWTLIGLRAGLAIGGFAFIFGLVRGWDFVMWGGVAVGGGCAFGLFVQRHPVLFLVIGLGIALAVVGPWFWHRHLKHIAPAAPAK